MKTFEEVQNIYNTYMDECEAYVEKAVATEFIMTPPSFETMKQIIDQEGGLRETGFKPLRDRSSTIIRHHYSNYDEMIRNLPAPACENRFKYLVFKTIKNWVNAHYREAILQTASP
jgi:hypothetical protein